MKLMKRVNLKLVFLGATVVLSAVLLWQSTEAWRYRHFPSTCPLSKYFPDKNLATKCTYSGHIDFSIEFQTEGTRLVLEEALEKFLDENPTFAMSKPINQNRIVLKASNDKLAEFHWNNGLITMVYDSW